MFTQTGSSSMILRCWEPSQPPLAKLGPTGPHCGADPAEQSFAPHHSHPVKGFKALSSPHCGRKASFMIECPECAAATF